MNIFQENKLSALRITAAISLIAGSWSLLFEIYFFHNFSIDIYFARLLLTLFSFLIFIGSFKNLPDRVITIFLHFIVFALISSFLYTIYKIPSTLFVNIQILSLVIFTLSLVYSWDPKNQILVAIYYNLLFAGSIFFNSSNIYLLPNLFSAVIYVALISMLSILASFVILKLKKMYLEKLSEINFLFNHAPVGICKIDLEGNIIAFNQYISDYFKLSDVKNEYNFFDLFDDKSIKQQFIDSARISDKILINVKNESGGSETFLKILANKLAGKTELFQILIVNETTEALAQKEKEDFNKKILEEKKNKIQLLAKINHEVRTPLSSILMYFEMLEGDYLKSFDEVKKYSKSVKTASQSLLNTINNFIDYAKIETGNLEVENDLFNLSDEVESVVFLLSNLASNKNDKLILEEGVIAQNIVFADATKYRQILINLVANSIKFTQNGTVKVCVENISKGGEDYEIITSVEDTGPGIPDEKLENIFDPFVTLKNGAQANYSSGLGLAICTEFVRMMHGKINVESKIGKGTKFTFSIPYKYDYKSAFNKLL